MKKVRNNRQGFSLIEMLIATAIMTIGLVMIATIFPVGVKLTGLSTERSIAAVVADEAFAKVQLYRLRNFVDWPVPDPNAPCADFMFTTYFNLGPDEIPETADDVYVDSTWEEFLYPSVVLDPLDPPQYHWSVLCRRNLLSSPKDVQVTVFVTHTTFAGMNYYGYPYDDPIASAYSPVNTSAWPVPVPVNVEYDPTKTTSSPLKELEILADADNLLWGTNSSGTPLVYSFFDESYTVVNNRDGKIYRILEMKDTDSNGTRETMVLYEDWDSDPAATFPVTETLWVVPPGVGSSRYPCAGVFQRVIRFDEIK